MGKGKKSFSLADVGKALEFARKSAENLERERSEKFRIASWADGFFSFVSAVGDCASPEEIELKAEFLGVGIPDPEGVSRLVGKYPEYTDEVLWRRLEQACVRSFAEDALSNRFAKSAVCGKAAAASWRALPAVLWYVSSRRLGWLSSNAQSKLKKRFGAPASLFRETPERRNSEDALVSMLEQLDCFAVRPRTGVSGK